MPWAQVQAESLARSLDPNHLLLLGGFGFGGALFFGASWGWMRRRRKHPHS